LAGDEGGAGRSGKYSGPVCPHADKPMSKIIDRMRSR